MPLTALIVDDEQPARDELVYLLKGFQTSRLWGRARTDSTPFT